MSPDILIVLNHTKPQNLNRGYNTPEPPPPSSSLLASPGTPTWLKNGLVRLKSLDYTFGDQNTAIPTPKQRRVHKQQKIDAHAYRMKILAGRGGKGGLSSSTGHLAMDTTELDAVAAEKAAVHDVKKSPGFRREKQLDKQRKIEKRMETQVSEEEGHKSSFAQCTFNMANILMVWPISCALFDGAIKLIAFNLSHNLARCWLLARRELVCLVFHTYSNLLGGLEVHVSRLVSAW